MEQSETTETEPETKRGRVRRLLIAPLEERGMRFKHGTPVDRQKRFIAGLCDDLSYLSDNSLALLVAWAKVNGQGSAKCFWPERIAFLQLAHTYEPRALKDVRGVTSWFSGQAGREAAAVPGRLVAEYRFWRKWLKPPVFDKEKQFVAAKAKEWLQHAERAREFRSGGRSYDQEFLDAYEADEAAARALMRAAP